MFTASEIALRVTVSPFDVSVALGELYDRTRKIVPIFRTDKIQSGSRGTFTRDLGNDLNYISIPFSMPAAEEIIVLAHEFGHAENCLYETSRWDALVPSFIYLAKGLKPPDGGFLAIEEEVRANERGRRHLVEICPAIVSEYDRQMMMSLMTFALRIGRLP